MIELFDYLVVFPKPQESTRELCEQNMQSQQASDPGFRLLMAAKTEIHTCPF